MIYILLFFLLFYHVVKYDESLVVKNRAGEYSRNANRQYWILMCIFILIAGLRNKVGLDTYSYMKMWNYEIPALEDITPLFFATAKYQPLWYILSSVCKEINSSFFFFQFIHACIVNFIVFYFVNKHSTHKFSVIFIYSLVIYLYFNCEIMRESLAVCFFLLAYDSLVERRWTKYFLLVFVAFMFHSGAIMLFLLPLVRGILNKPLTVKALVTIALVSLVMAYGGAVTFVLGKINPAWVKSFGNYSRMEIATIFGWIRGVLNVILLIYMYKKWSRNICENEKDRVGFTLYVILLMIGLSLHIVETRLANYVKLFYVIALCDFFWYYYRKKKNLYVVTIYSLFVFGIFRYYYRDVSSWVYDKTRTYYFYDAYYPYYSIFEDVPKDVDNKRNAIHMQEVIQDEKSEGHNY